MTVGSIISLTAGKIGELLIEEAKFLKGVENQVRSLQGELKWMNSFLKDMDDGGSDERSQTITAEIRKIAYDAEDVIESFILEARSSPDKEKGFFSRYLCFCSCLAHTHQLGCEIEAIKLRISETMERLKRQNGGRTEEGLSRSKRTRRRPIAYSYGYEDHVVGLDNDVSQLVGVLTANKSPIQVLSVAGMGGSGKTTLARKLYNQEPIKSHFDCMAWVSISEEWVAHHILIDILRKTSGQTMRLDEAWGSHVVVEKLQGYLDRKKYLIVLDDVWKKQALEEILPALPLGCGEGRIMVTTRFTEVVDFPDLKCLIHEPRRLTEEESWELFRKIALGDLEESDVALEVLGKEMLKKCEGLPLAVVALAGILRNKDGVDEWEKVKRSVSSKIMEGGRGTYLYGTVKEMLALSYDDLPYELKPCFLYLAVFPEDSEIPAGMLIRMWIAEGFITPDQVHQGETPEDVAMKHLDELIQRCVVRVATTNYKGKVKSIQIHDLMRDLCLKKAREQDFLEMFSSRSSATDSRVTHSRRTVIHSYNRIYFPFPTGNSHLRSLFLFARPNVGIFKTHTLEDRPKLCFAPIHQNFRLLRVLNFVGVDTSSGALPTEIGSLIHLRYLGLRVTNIHQIPSSIQNLQHLQTFDYRAMEDFDKTVKIPDVFWKINGLRHLYLPFDRKPMKELKLNTLKQLQTLWGLGGGDWMLKEMPQLSNNVRKLRIEGIRSAEQLEAAFQCPSIVADHLLSLHLDWLGRCGGGDPLLNSLKPVSHCQRLRKLGLRGKIDDKSGCITFPCGINKLNLWFTQLEDQRTLGVLGKLANLMFLDLSRNSYLGNRWCCVAGEFVQLKKLRLLDLPHLEEWSIEKGAMLHLRKLTIWQCRNLRNLPIGLKFITTLQELEFNAMEDEFNRRVDSEGEDFHIIQHIPVVRYL